MAQKQFLVVIEEETILEDAGTADKVTQLEAQFLDIIQEINMCNTHVHLKVTSIVEQ
jgi:hypothetical protein